MLWYAYDKQAGYFDWLPRQKCGIDFHVSVCRFLKHLANALANAISSMRITHDLFNLFLLKFNYTLIVDTFHLFICFAFDCCGHHKIYDHDLFPVSHSRFSIVWKNTRCSRFHPSVSLHTISFHFCGIFA